MGFTCESMLGMLTQPLWSRPNSVFGVLCLVKKEQQGTHGSMRASSHIQPPLRASAQDDPSNHVGSGNEVDRTVVGKLGKAPSVGIVTTGLVVTQKQGCCSGIAAFVPWSGVVSADLTTGPFRGDIHIRTIIRKKMRLIGQSTSSFKEEDSGHHNTDKPTSAESEFADVFIRGKKSDMEAVFEQVLKLLTPAGAEPLEAPPKIPRTTLAPAGVVSSTVSLCGVCKKQTIMPWMAVTTVEYRGGGCFRSGRLTLVDRVGERMKVNGCSIDAYNQFSELCSSRRARFHEDRPPPIMRGGVKISWDGISFPVKSGFCDKQIKFFPWKEVDAAEMSLGCFTGSIKLITENGQKIDLGNVGSKRRAKETSNALMQMKYHGKASPDLYTSCVFAGNKGDLAACVLTDVSLKLVSKAGLFKELTTVVDLDSVGECKVVHQGCMKTEYLMVFINEGMGAAMEVDDALSSKATKRLKKEQENNQCIIVRLRGIDNGANICQDIMRRASVRKALEKALA
eukprot:TRINITY_DN47350_c0_g1_i1.p1 TRINITY_DN47350_c0_g1~~TRINITY_DN47350_c0_g1_i1.p1  ORF type:complete len:509 (+),score=98.47 TRINITY_DN47350_c0_g1_i1:68-1594(+)